MDFKTIDFATNDGIGQLTFDRPDVLNSFDDSMHSEVREALQAVETDANCRVLLLTGSGRGFCAGQDLSARRRAADLEMVDLGDSLDLNYNPLIRKLRTLPIPVVCAVNGVAAGAGVGIALACDIVLAAQSARFVMSFARLGLVPDSGATWTLPRLIGQARASALIMLGESIDADQAEKCGMVWKCVADDALVTEAHEICRRLAAVPSRGLALTRQALAATWSNSLDQQLDLERDLQREAGRSEDYAEAVSDFLQKRDARFTGK